MNQYPGTHNCPPVARGMLTTDFCENKHEWRAQEYLSPRCGGWATLFRSRHFLALTRSGAEFMLGFGVDPKTLESARRPVGRACLDWSARRNHLAGPLGVALLRRFYDLKWARRVEQTRIIRFSRAGEKAFLETFDVA